MKLAKNYRPSKAIEISTNLVHTGKSLRLSCATRASIVATHNATKMNLKRFTIVVNTDLIVHLRQINYKKFVNVWMRMDVTDIYIFFFFFVSVKIVTAVSPFVNVTNSCHKNNFAPF